MFQIPYSALEREHEEWITKSAEAGVGIVIRGGVAQGEPGAVQPNERQARKWETFEKAGLDELRAQGESRSAFILRYTLSHLHADTNIVGTSSPDHLAENVRSIAAGPLSTEVYAEAKRRLDKVGEKPADAS